MNQCDLAVVTGSQNNVKRAMQSGTVAIGVGAGNVPVIIDSTADLDDAALKITASKIFDNATSCSSENAVVILDDVYEDAIAALERAGGWRCSAEEKARVEDTLWVKGNLNRRVIAKDADVTAEIRKLDVTDPRQADLDDRLRRRRAAMEEQLFAIMQANTRI